VAAPAVDRQKIAVLPFRIEAYDQAVVNAGGVVAELSPDVGALIWLDYSKPAALAQLLDENPQIEWVQLPFAGVDAFSELIKRPIQFTSAKGSYAEPVAEHAMALALALGRIIPERAKAISWGHQYANSFYDSNILIVGGGGITEELLKFLAPYRAKISVVRKRPAADLIGCAEYSPDMLDELLPAADLVFLACALTEQTHHLIDAKRLSSMKPDSLLVNVARGAVINTDDLVLALNSGQIGGAALDVTDPEPLPEGHPLWTAQNILITPHTADTKVQVIRLFSQRIFVNVSAYREGRQLIGKVDATLGY